MLQRRAASAMVKAGMARSPRSRPRPLAPPAVGIIRASSVSMRARVVLTSALILHLPGT